MAHNQRTLDTLLETGTLSASITYIGDKMLVETVHDFIIESMAKLEIEIVEDSINIVFNNEFQLSASFQSAKGSFIYLGYSYGGSSISQKFNYDKITRIVRDNEGIPLALACRLLIQPLPSLKGFFNGTYDDFYISDFNTSRISSFSTTIDL